MSHCHPEGTPTRRASVYGLPIDPVKGESEVSIGQPKLIHQNDLKLNNPPMAMSLGDYMALKTEICLYFIFTFFYNGKLIWWRWLGRNFRTMWSSASLRPMPYFEGTTFYRPGCIIDFWHSEVLILNYCNINCTIGTIYISRRLFYYTLHSSLLIFYSRNKDLQCSKNTRLHHNTA